MASKIWFWSGCARNASEKVHGGFLVLKIVDRRSVTFLSVILFVGCVQTVWRKKAQKWNYSKLTQCPVIIQSGSGPVQCPLSLKPARSMLPPPHAPEGCSVNEPPTASSSDVCVNGEVLIPTERRSVFSADNRTAFAELACSLSQNWGTKINWTEWVLVQAHEPKHPQSTRDWLILLFLLWHREEENSVEPEWTTV